MKEHFVIDPLISKRQQLLLATQLCRMVLKVSAQSILHAHLNFPTLILITSLDQQRHHCRRRRPGLLGSALACSCQRRPAFHLSALLATDCDVTESEEPGASRRGSKRVQKEAPCDDQKLGKRYHIDEGMKEVNNTAETHYPCCVTTGHPLLDLEDRRARCLMTFISDLGCLELCRSVMYL